MTHDHFTFVSLCDVIRNALYEYIIISFLWETPMLGHGVALGYGSTETFEY